MTTDVAENRWLKAAEAAKKLGVSPSTLRWWRHKGRGPLAVRIAGGQHKYRESEIDAYLEQCEQEARDAREWARLRPPAA
jgi:excisionase family DNA binding protein